MEGRIRHGGQADVDLQGVQGAAVGVVGIAVGDAAGVQLSCEGGHRAEEGETHPGPVLRVDAQQGVLQQLLNVPGPIHRPGKADAHRTAGLPGLPGQGINGGLLQENPPAAVPGIFVQQHRRGRQDRVAQADDAPDARLHLLLAVVGRAGQGFGHVQQVIVDDVDEVFPSLLQQPGQVQLVGVVQAAHQHRLRPGQVLPADAHGGFVSVFHSTPGGQLLQLAVAAQPHRGDHQLVDQ